MRTISKRRVVNFWQGRDRQDSEAELRLWLDIVKMATWANPADVKATFGHRVDFVQTRETKNTVAVFDIANNRYRLIAHIHYLDVHPEKGRVYVLKLMTHKEYDKKKWMDEL
jgi:mRNA interferase HigB